MKPAGHPANTPSTLNTGLFAALAALVGFKGSGARSFLILPVVVLASLAFTAAPALAAAPEVPAVSVESITATGATFSDTLNPVTFPVENGTYQYLYRKTKTAGCAGEGKAPVPAGTYLGEAPESFPQAVSNLAPDAYYTVCLHAENTAKEAATSTPVTFETAPEAPGAPTVSPIEATTATLHGVLNPKSAGEPGTYEFLYQESASECAGGAPTTQEAATGAEKQPAKEAELTGLTPGVQYTVCLKLTNEAGETTLGAPVTFRALSVPPVVTPETTSSTEVTSTSATLDAEVNPGGGETSYHFEYDTTPYKEGEAAHGKSTPEAILNGSDNSAHPASAQVQGLEPATEYHYRIVVHNAAQGVGGSTAYGPDESFTTHATGGEFRLPDDRAWEQVSPVDKYGARIEAITNEGGVIQAAEDGSGIAYVANAPVVANPEANPALYESQVLSKRGADGGWSSRDIATPHEVALIDVPSGYFTEYYAFSPDLSRGVIQRGTNGAEETPLSPEAKERTLYLREDLGEAGAGDYLPLVNDNNVPPGTHYGHHEQYIAASSNLEHVVVASEVALTSGLVQNGPEAGGLYEWSKDTPSSAPLEPISVLPNGKLVEPSQASIGNNEYNVRNAISESGESVFWGNERHLYVREGVGTPQARTVQLDLPQGVGPSGESPEALFQYATPSGERVYFTDIQQLTAGSTAAGGEPELYEYDFSKQPGERLTDLTPNPAGAGNPSIDVQGEVIGATDNGEYVYFVAKGVLTSGPNAEGHEPVAEAPNLYLLHTQGETRTPVFIATLSTKDRHDWEGEPIKHMTSRMSPNGRFLAFMSELELTGYDNHDAVSGEPDEEVFEYDEATQRIVCASCDPTGARPHGVQDLEEAGEGLGLLVDRPEIWAERWLAGSVPGYTANAERKYTDYQSRYLSNDGRLFFDAADALVPQDTNGKEDVYEYEPAGLGPENARCGPEASSASEVYEPSSAGCVALISSGESGEESAFLDASGIGKGGEEAEDVFFLTSSKLSPLDLDTADDVYDAHVCSTAAPCASSAAVSPPCTTTDSCRVAPAAQPSIYGAPASATFSGAGNAAAPAPEKVTKKTVKCKKNFVKNKKGKCVRKKSKKKARRASNDRRVTR